MLACLICAGVDKSWKASDLSECADEGVALQDSSLCSRETLSDMYQLSNMCAYWICYGCAPQKRSRLLTQDLPTNAGTAPGGHHSNLHSSVGASLSQDPLQQSGLLIVDSDAGEAPVPPGCSSGCPSGWTQFGSRCFIFYRTAKSWIDAEHFCMSIGGNLASIHSADENIFLSNLVKRVTGAHYHTWVGGSDAVAEKRWLWSDGSHFDYLRWFRGQPDNHKGNEHCLEINYGVTYWNDGSCTGGRSFICAKKL
ncbi:galactose-specific lectin nattectin-like [Leuresthes tenuis]|uniref:galactose-specific lectin nattectin-like n=2 Tax=Leuresthes tenuis TaxID=355514 RepID=UPI003B512605